MSQLIWSDNSTYFLTCSTFLHYPYFNEPNKKAILLKRIKRLEGKFGIKKVSYSIMINHYHLKFYLKNGLDLAKIKKYLHGGTSFEYKKQYDIKYKDFWQPPKTLKILSQEMDWKVTGYIIGNLLKHKEVSKIDQLEGNVFCTYDDFIKEHGKEIAKDLVYSVINTEEDKNNFIDFKELNELELNKKD